MIVWTTESNLNQVVCRTALEGLKRAGLSAETRPASKYDGKPVPSVSYGFLRGVERIYKDCARAGVEWWNIDKGFFRHRHTDGYYRLARNHLQPLFRLTSTQIGDLDDSRWKALKIEPAPFHLHPEGHVLLCPPTDHIARFYGIGERSWIEETISKLPETLRGRVRIRRKGDPGEAADAIRGARVVLTHSSNMAIEALVMGIPAFAQEGLLASWSGATLEHAGNDLSCKLILGYRSDLFKYAACCQFTLEEFRTGLAWEESMALQKGPVRERA